MRQLIPLIVLLFSAQAHAQSWSAPTEVTDARGTGEDLGAYTSMEMVNGKPAIACVDGAHHRINWVLAQDGDGTTWNEPVSISTPGIEGTHLSMLVVNGNPAIAYYRYESPSNGSLMFIRANDADGTSWGTPVLVDDVGNAGRFASLDIVNGRPAIAYERINGSWWVMYVRANDADGTSWGAPTSVASNALAQAYGIALEVVNGNPAIAYNIYEFTRYVRSSDADGSAWPTPVTLLQDFPGQGQVSLRVIGGIPCVLYYNSDDVHLKFQRANDVDGASWAAASNVHFNPTQVASCALLEVEGWPAIVVQLPATDQLIYSRAGDAQGSSWVSSVLLDAVDGFPAYPSFGLVNGYPAVAYYKQNISLPGELKFVRATNTTGTAPWNAPIGFRTYPDVGQHVSQAFVGGFPALAYYDATNKDLRYVRATDALGSIWGTSITIDSVNACGSYTSMTVVNGNPAITYYDETLNLKYVRADDALGATWGTPVVLPAATASYGQSSALVVIGGHPAVAFVSSTGSSVFYIRALDADGASWPASSTAFATSSGIGVGISLVEMNGLPAVAYFGNNMDLMFSAALNIDGTSWATAVNIDATGVVGQYPSLAIVDGNPAIAYYDVTNTQLKYTRANLPNGTGWGYIATVDNNGDAGKYPSLMVVDGYPTIAYSGGDVRIIRASTVDGVLGWGVAPLHLATSSNPLMHVSMRLNGAAAGVSYYDPYQDYAYYVGGAQCAFAPSAPVDATPPADLSICYGASTTLMVTGTGSISWYNASLGGTFLGSGAVLTTGNLTSTQAFFAQDSACYLSPRTGILVTVAAAINANVSVTGNSLTALANGASYQWVDCNNGYAPIANATDQIYNAPVSGSYAVIVTVGACSDTSACEAVITTGAEDLRGPEEVKVFPNPAQRILNIRTNAPGPFELTLLDASGRVVRRMNNAPQLSVLDVADMRRGCYVLKVRSAAFSTAHHVVLE